MAVRKQRYSTYMLYTLVADAAGLPLREVFWNPAAIVDAYHRIHDGALSPALREAFAAVLREPSLAPISYGHVAALGCRVEQPPDGEPNALPCLDGPGAVDALRDPDDFMANPLAQERIAAAAEVARLWGGGIDVGPRISWQGPVTTAVLLAGMEFLTWPIDHPEAAHALLRFSTESALRYAHHCRALHGDEVRTREVCIFDDFAGLFSPSMFRDFVLPCWDLYYELTGCEVRSLHSELLRPGHLPLLPEIGITHFDPGADGFLTPEILRDQCPVTFQLRILDWHLRDNNEDQLRAMYRRFAAFEPEVIEFGIERKWEEERYLALLDEARRLAAEA